uniref:Peptidase S33 tripeptidyl aminopeptidase-like C-terminal domain-containing protein n=1 Tax=Emiliania huxleyi TaxID=2903 RepID=A0A7S3TM72_EMIHU
MATLPQETALSEQSTTKTVPEVAERGLLFASSPMSSSCPNADGCCPAFQYFQKGELTGDNLKVIRENDYGDRQAAFSAACGNCTATPECGGIVNYMRVFYLKSGSHDSTGNSWTWIKTPTPSPPPSPATPNIRNPDPSTFKWELSFYKCTWTNSLYGYSWYTVKKPQEELNPDCGPEYRVGYLTVPLDYDDSTVENEISLELRVSAKLACSTGDSVEPCPVIFYHNGGPSSNDHSGTSNKNYGGRYDTIGIAQRGIGEDDYWLHEQIYNGTFDADGNINQNSFLFDPYKKFPVDKSGNNKNLADSNSWPQHTQNACRGYQAQVEQGIHPPKNWYLDPEEDKQEIRDKFRFADVAMRDCVKDEHWKIELPGQGTGKPANFLDYVGTHLLARDIDRLRESFGAEKLSCYGFSYGTAVCSTYAAQFPDKLDLFVVNGNVDHPGTTDTYQTNVADAFNQLGTKLLKICNNGYGNSNCLGSRDESPAEHFERTTNEIRTNPKFRFDTTESKEVFKFPVGFIYDMFASVRGFDAEDSALWIETLDAIKAVVHWVNAIVNMPDFELAQVIVRHAISDRNLSKWIPGLPANRPGTQPGQSNPYWICGNSDWHATGTCKQHRYHWLYMSTTTAINSLDYANRFSWLQTAQLTEFLGQKYPPFAVYKAINDGPKYMMYPREPTPCVYGFRSGVKGIVINSLYDGATPYINAKTMREGMSSTALVTWQGIGHCVASATYDKEGVDKCLRKVDTYFKTHGATLPIDGFTCRNSKQILSLEEQAHENYEANPTPENLLLSHQDLCQSCKSLAEKDPTVCEWYSGTNLCRDCDRPDICK